MTIQAINHGTVAGDGTGESLFSAFTKVNANFSELYGFSATALYSSAIGVTVQGYSANLTTWAGTTPSAFQAYDADLTTWAGVTPGTGIATALAVNVGTAGAPVLNGGALGTPSSGTLTNCTGLPAAGVTGTALTAAAAVTVAQGGTGRATSTTAYGLIAAGTTATGAHQTLAAGATTEILVGGGASALPVWTTATGSGAPVRATSPSLVTPVLGTPTSGDLSNCTADGTNAVGFRHVPQITKSADGAPTTGADLTYAGKHIYHTSTAGTFTIPANSSIAYPIGTALSFANGNGAGTLTIAITTDTMRLAGAGTTGSRSLAANGVATALKVSSTEWIISGTGLT